MNGENEDYNFDSFGKANFFHFWLKMLGVQIGGKNA